MRVLVVCSGNILGFEFRKHQSFVYEQIEAVSRGFTGFRYDTYFFKGHGALSYFRNLSKLRQKIKGFHPDVLHAHGGHIGAFCSLQRSVPVVTTFHGSDINRGPQRIISLVAYLLSAASIFVSEELRKKMPLRFHNSFVIPCGVDLNIFRQQERKKAKKSLGIPETEKYVLFSSSFKNAVKNFPLAMKAIASFSGINIREIDGRSREEVCALINGSELLLLTSFKEGSPQVIKEAMACNLPIVSVKVGDVEETLGGTEGTFLTSYDPADVTDKISKALEFGKRTNGREKIEYLDNRIVAARVYGVFSQVLSMKSAIL